MKEEKKEILAKNLNSLYSFGTHIAKSMLLGLNGETTGCFCPISLDI